mgnify:CR=1 FL=1
MAIIKQQQTIPIISYGQMNMQNDFRALTAQMSILSGSYITSIAAGFGNDAAIAGRLYGLPVKFIEKIQMAFGTPSMNALLHLLQMHVIYLITLVNAMKTGDVESIDTNTAQLYRNADDISARFASINPFWDGVQWRNLLNSYIAMTIEEAICVMAGNFEKHLDVCDRLLHHALFMGDYIAAGMLRYLSITQRNAGIQRIQANLKKAKAAARK